MLDVWVNIFDLYGCIIGVVLIVVLSKAVVSVTQIIRLETYRRKSAFAL